MRKVFWQMMVTLDGFMEGPNRELDWHAVDADFNRYVADMLSSIDAILLGRVTYQLFADYWPSSTDAEAQALRRSRRMTHLCSREMDHRRCRRRGRASLDAQEAPLQYLPPVVLSRPTSRRQAAGVLGAVVPGGATGADAGLVASTESRLLHGPPAAGARRK